MCCSASSSVRDTARGSTCDRARAARGPVAAWPAGSRPRPRRRAGTGAPGADDGTVLLGSQASPECQIDSLAAKLGRARASRAAGPGAAGPGAACSSVWPTVSSSASIKLFDPPLIRSTLDPGYIKGYVPGVRENGGQQAPMPRSGWPWPWPRPATPSRPFRELTPSCCCPPAIPAASRVSLAIPGGSLYVVAADVYAVGSHQVAWRLTWYIGSAGLSLYRLLVEVKLPWARAARAGCSPSRRARRAPGETGRYFRTTGKATPSYHLRLDPAGPGEAPGTELDGVRLAQDELALVDDQREHSGAGAGTREARRRSPPLDRYGRAPPRGTGRRGQRPQDAGVERLLRCQDQAPLRQSGQDGGAGLRRLARAADLRYQDPRGRTARFRAHVRALRGGAYLLALEEREGPGRRGAACADGGLLRG